MKTIGLIGGLSWESTSEYYRIINERVQRKLGGLHSAKCILFSVDFAEIEILQRAEHWSEATEIMINAAKAVERAGADFVMICSNTMHKMAQPVRDSIGIPLLHIADATAKKILVSNIKKVGLLGTLFTMEEEFYKGYLEQRFNLDVIIPDRESRNVVHHIIYKELCRGVIKKSSKEKYRLIVDQLVHQGAQGIILGCTEIGLLVNDIDLETPIFDTTLIHASAAVELALIHNGP
jgi:aspartate racemase